LRQTPEAQKVAALASYSPHTEENTDCLLSLISLGWPLFRNV
jgi:hypothetical protein